MSTATKARKIADARFNAEFLRAARERIATEGLSTYFTKNATELQDVGYSQAEAAHGTIMILWELGFEDARLTAELQLTGIDDNEPKYTLTQKARERMKFTHREVKGGTLCGSDGIRAWPEQEPTCADCRRMETEAKPLLASNRQRADATGRARST